MQTAKARADTFGDFRPFGAHLPLAPSVSFLLGQRQRVIHVETIRTRGSGLCPVFSVRFSRFLFAFLLLHWTCVVTWKPWKQLTSSPMTGATGSDIAHLYRPLCWRHKTTLGVSVFDHQHVLFILNRLACSRTGRVRCHRSPVSPRKTLK